MSEVRCGICDQPVKLESVAVNHEGKAVHEDCYVHQILDPKPADGGSQRTTSGGDLV